MGDSTILKILEKVSGQKKFYFLQNTCFVIHFVWMLLFLYERIYILSVFNVFSCAVYFGLHYVIAQGKITCAAGICYVEVLLHSVTAVLCFGFIGGFDLYILIFIPIMFFFSAAIGKGKKLALCSGILSGVVYVALKAALCFYTPVFSFSNITVKVLITLFNGLTAVMVLLVISYVCCGEMYRTRKALEDKNRKLMFLSGYDPLTKLLNRRSMNNIIKEAEAKTKSSEKNAVAFFDIDNFKKFNDTYGHDFGDYVLVKVAESIRNGVRDEDYVCRWGGEEMVVLFPNCNEQEVIEMVTAIKDYISETEFEVRGKKDNVSVTCGLAFGRKQISLEELINRADSYMLKGKRSGKNCVVIQ